MSKTDRSKRTWQPKASRKGKRSGIYSRPRPTRYGRVYAPDGSVTKLQQPFDVVVGKEMGVDGHYVEVRSITRVSYQGMTQMRYAFEQARIHSASPALRAKCLTALRRRAGTFSSSGWRVLRDDNQSRSRR